METQRQTVPTGLERKTDNELLRLSAEQRSEEAFAQLGRRYAGLIYTTCLREMGEPTQAEDAAQAVLLLLSQKAAELSRYETIVGWLYNTSRYTCRNLQRQQRRRQLTEKNASMDDVAAPTAPRNDLWDRVEPHFHDALSRLKPIDRDVILLRYVQEQSLFEIGKSLGLSENTARMRVSRALGKIRAHLAKAGVVLSVAALVALLEERAVQAAPPIVFAAIARIAASHSTATPIAKTVGGLPSVFRMGLSAKGVVIALGALVFIGGLFAYQWNRPRSMSFVEQQQQFAALSGTWRGAITFADDQNGKRYTYPTTVQFSVQNSGQILRFASIYSGSSREDVVTFAHDARTGFSIKDSGAQTSHALWGTGELVQTRDGGIAFQGNNKNNRAQIRLQFLRRGSHLIIREEYRPVVPFPALTAFSSYTFRNQYVLQRGL